MTNNRRSGGKRELDRTDVRILQLLQQKGDLSHAEIASRIGVTATTCWRHISRLKEQDVIRGSVTLLNRKKLDLNVMVFARVKLRSHGVDTLTRFEQAIRACAEVLECYTVLGETDFIIRIVSRDIDTLETFFREFLWKIPGVESISSSVILSAIKETTAFPLQAT